MTDPRPSRRRLGLVLAVVVLAAAAAVGAVRAAHPAHPAAAADPGLRSLRRAAALAPCPSGLGATLPALTLDCLGGGAAVRLTAPGSGLPTLVNVWAHWCPPCVQEVPYLVALQGKAHGALAIVGVLTEDDPATGLRFAADFGMHYPSLVDPDGTVMRAYPPGPPVTLFLDRAGRVVWRHGGRFHSQAELEHEITARLGVAL